MIGVRLKQLIFKITLLFIDCIPINRIINIICKKGLSLQRSLYLKINLGLPINNYGIYLGRLLVQLCQEFRPVDDITDMGAFPNHTMGIACRKGES